MTHMISFGGLLRQFLFHGMVLGQKNIGELKKFLINGGRL